MELNSTHNCYRCFVDVHVDGSEPDQTKVSSSKSPTYNFGLDFGLSDFLSDCLFLSWITASYR